MAGSAQGTRVTGTAGRGAEARKGRKAPRRTKGVQRAVRPPEARALDQPALLRRAGPAAQPAAEPARATRELA